MFSFPPLFFSSFIFIFHSFPSLHFLAYGTTIRSSVFYITFTMPSRTLISQQTGRGRSRVWTTGTERFALNLVMSLAGPDRKSYRRRSQVFEYHQQSEGEDQGRERHSFVCTLTRAPNLASESILLNRVPPRCEDIDLYASTSSIHSKCFLYVLSMLQSQC